MRAPEGARRCDILEMHPLSVHRERESLSGRLERVRCELTVSLAALKVVEMSKPEIPSPTAQELQLLLFFIP